MDWKPIEDFPGYSVCYDGKIRNDKFDRLMVTSTNQFGILQVGLMRDGRQYKRSVVLIVAREFLDPPTPPTFNTPIQLDGDRTNCHIQNLMWRPRWFAVKYHQQFENGKRGFTEPVMEVNTEEWFPNSWEAATKYGLLDREIMIATLNRTYVWPTYQEFRLVH